MHDHHNNNLPQNMYNIHKKHKNKFKLSKSLIYKIPYTKKSQLLNSILTIGPKLWNDLNRDIQIIKNKNSYKKNKKSEGTSKQKDDKVVAPTARMLRIPLRTAPVKKPVLLVRMLILIPLRQEHLNRRTIK